MMTSTQRICLWGTVLLSSLDNSTLLTMETSTQPTNWAARKRGGSLIIITLTLLSNLLVQFMFKKINKFQRLIKSDTSESVKGLVSFVQCLK